jgi:hypothetical protein
MRRSLLVAAAVLALLSACATPRRDALGDGASATPSPTASPSAALVETKTVTLTQPVPFEVTTVNDANLPQGQTSLRVAGVNGVRTLTFAVTYRGGVETGRTQTKDEVTTPPVTQVTAVGTKVAAPPAPPAQSCHPNYTGACVPIASDVDCAGGGGNGPAYVRGPVYVVGPDVYDLDRDGDGVACE